MFFEGIKNLDKGKKRKVNRFFQQGIIDKKKEESFVVDLVCGKMKWILLLFDLLI